MNDLSNEKLEQLRYPIGRFKYPEEYSEEQMKEWIINIENFPANLKKEVENLSESQLNTPYRPGGWTIKQLVHHLADSHINSYVRLKLTLTEDEPAIKPYFEERWATLKDSELVPVEESLKLLDGLHKRWTAILKNLTEAQWERKYFHPENKKLVSIKAMTALYSWHCNHHLTHITNLKQKKGWK